jgi:predicted ester cyclase
VTSAARRRAELTGRAIQRLHAAVNAHDTDAIAACCAEHVIWQDPAAPGVLKGREAVRRFHADVMLRALPDVRVEIAEGPYLSDDGEHAAVRLRIRGTMTGPLKPPGFGPTGRRLEFETAEFSRFEGELLVSHRVVVDMLALARQISAAPRAGSLLDRTNVALQRISAWWLRRGAGAGSGAPSPNEAGRHRRLRV